MTRESKSIPARPPFRCGGFFALRAAASSAALPILKKWRKATKQVLKNHGKYYINDI